MKCRVDGCESSDHSRQGMCNKHYRRFMRYGDPFTLKNRPAGSGTKHIDGYWAYEIDGRVVLRHILIAERAIGHRLPKGAHVHHVDGNPGNDANTNLVVCPSSAYHQLLHVRTRAYDACGHADWLRCSICGDWSPPEQIKIYYPSMNRWHPECRRANPVNRGVGK